MMARRILLLAGTCLTLGACNVERHELSRPVDPPLDAFDWGAVYAAGTALVVLWAVHVTRVLSPRIGWRRFVALSILHGFTVLGVGAAAITIATHLRAEAVLDGGECREIPVVERPATIIQFDCTSLGLDGPEVYAVLLVVFLPVIGLPSVLAGLALGGRWMRGIALVGTGVGFVLALAGAVETVPELDRLDHALWYLSPVLLGVSFVLQLRAPRAEPP